ncbi:hypothetical protein [Pseudomonas sp. D3-10]|uniref:hypothetical protein n=1 Tax=Pseudomonas sp. D3-10 TaxID=2817392 RepID=UPI003DA98216
MDQSTVEAAKRQSELEAAKAAFFASGGTAQQIPAGVGKDSPGTVTVAKTPYGYRNIEAQKTKRGRVITQEERDKIAAELMECKAAGMTRNKACKHMGISTTLARRIVADYSLDFPTNA